MFALIFAMNRNPAVESDGPQTFKHARPGHDSLLQWHDSALPARLAERGIFDLLPRQVFDRNQCDTAAEQVKAHSPAIAAAFDAHVSRIDISADRRGMAV